MARYYESESLIDFVKQNTPHMNGETTMKCVEFAIKNAPTADVVPKSEYDAVVSAVDNSTKEFLKLHDKYQEAKREVEMLQGALKAEERHNELTMEMAQKALKNAKADVAREIFAKIESILDPIIQLNYEISVQHEDPIERAKAISAEQALRAFRDYVAELKKKYTEGEPNG